MKKESKPKIPEFQDEVKHKKNEATGIVIAVYEVDGDLFFDVRSSSEDRVYYMTLAENWTTISTEQERIFGKHKPQ